MTYEDIDGWFNYEALYRAAVDRAPARAAFAEVGCWLGRSAAYLAGLIRGSGKDITLWAVDHGFGTVSGVESALHAPLLEANGGNTMGRLAANLRDCGVLDVVAPLIVPSVRAAALFPDGHFDFVFVDAAHDYDSVRADVAAWWPKVRPGGWMAGHDYDHHWPSVVAAVNDHFGRGVPDPDCPHCWSVPKE